MPWFGGYGGGAKVGGYGGGAKIGGYGGGASSYGGYGGGSKVGGYGGGTGLSSSRFPFFSGFSSYDYYPWRPNIFVDLSFQDVVIIVCIILIIFAILYFWELKMANEGVTDGYYARRVSNHELLGQLPTTDYLNQNAGYQLTLKVIEALEETGRRRAAMDNIEAKQGTFTMG